ncbi:MAG: hypothetical protein NXI01_09315 [Gammaproteobacteria bacterium]|nr:hypothetical protein [Gammaproteobacteria bacterium]
MNTETEEGLKIIPEFTDDELSCNWIWHVESIMTYGEIIDLPDVITAHFCKDKSR